MNHVLPTPEHYRRDLKLRVCIEIDITYNNKQKLLKSMIAVIPLIIDYNNLEHEFCIYCMYYYHRFPYMIYRIIKIMFSFVSGRYPSSKRRFDINLIKQSSILIFD